MTLPFYGNAGVRATLDHMREESRIPQTILLHGPSGIGKATLARRFASALMGHAAQIEADDLSLPDNVNLIAEREKLPSDKRNDEPLLFGSHPDFLTFPPDGPLRQISIEQIRTLKERAQFSPATGRHRVFLIDQIDRANESAANSLLKILEEPPPYLIVFMTADNAYDLLPTIRSRAVMFPMAPLADEELGRFVAERALDQPERRVALANGTPGRAVTLDLDAYDKRRTAMLAFLEAASGKSDFSLWAKYAESIQASKAEKLEWYLDVLFVLLEDLLLLQHGWERLRNPDVRARLQKVAERVDFAWIRRAVAKTQDLEGLLRRNIQKGIALDALLLELAGR